MLFFLIWTTFFRKGTSHWKFWGGSRISNLLCLHIVKERQKPRIKNDQFHIYMTLRSTLLFFRFMYIALERKPYSACWKDFPDLNTIYIIYCWLWLRKARKSPTFVQSCNCQKIATGSPFLLCSANTQSLHGWSPGSPRVPLCNKCFNSSGDNALCLLPTLAQAS